MGGVVWQRIVLAVSTGVMIALVETQWFQGRRSLIVLGLSIPAVLLLSWRVKHHQWAVALAFATALTASALVLNVLTRLALIIHLSNIDFEPLVISVAPAWMASLAVLLVAYLQRVVDNLRRGHGHDRVLRSLKPERKALAR